MQHKAMSIRRASSVDALPLAQLARGTYVAAFGASMAPTDLAAHLERTLSDSAIAQMLAVDTLLVAEAAGRMVGFVQFGAALGSVAGAAAGDMELRRLYVDQAQQRRGIGSSLLARALADPQMARAARVWLDVWEHNPGAQALYGRFGFRVAGRRRFEVASGAPSSDDLIMLRECGAGDG